MMKHAFTRLGVKAIVALSVGLGAWTSGEAQRLYWLDLPSSSEGVDVSLNGVVVGNYINPQGYTRAFRWNPRQNQFTDLGTLNNTCCAHAVAVSVDGNIIVGRSNNKTFRWTPASGMVVIYDYWYFTAHGMSSSGNTVAGVYINPNLPSFIHGAIWTPTGLTTTSSDYAFHGISPDGTVAVGQNTFRNEGIYYIVASQRILNIPHLPNGSQTRPRAASASGDVIVGVAKDAQGRDRAFRWRQTTGTVDLGALVSTSSAWDVTGDGGTVVGYSPNAFGLPRAVRWDANGNIEDLNVAYANLVRDGSYLIEARAISLDGRFITGYGYNAQTGLMQAFLLDTGNVPSPPRADVNNDCVVDDADLLEVLFSFGTGCGG
jgi:probable HAF family extracellular repeat protein